jgi:hypothetical protein
MAKCRAARTPIAAGFRDCSIALPPFTTLFAVVDRRPGTVDRLYAMMGDGSLEALAFNVNDRVTKSTSSGSSWRTSVPHTPTVSTCRIPAPKLRALPVLTGLPLKPGDC